MLVPWPVSPFVRHCCITFIDIDPGQCSAGNCVMLSPTNDHSWSFASMSSSVDRCWCSPTRSVRPVSRELGIPAVVSVPSAMQKLVTGMVVEVDGTTGEITVLDVPGV